MSMKASCRKHLFFKTPVKHLNSGHLRVLKNLSVVKMCPLLGDSLTKIVTFGTKHFVRYSRHVCYLGCPLLGGFTALCHPWDVNLIQHYWPKNTFI